MRALRAVSRLLLAMFVLVAERLRARRLARRIVPPPEDERHAPAVVTLLLLSAAGCSTAFVVLYIVEAGTQFLGLALGVAFLLLGAASIVAAKRLVPQTEESEEVGSRQHDDARRDTARIVREGGEGLSRRSLLLGAGAAAGATGAALVIPAASLGPVLDSERLRSSPWEEDRALVDADGRPILADDLALGSFLAAFPEGAPPGSIDASLVVCRMRPDELRLPPERTDWAPEGIAAYSRICTHAGCAVSQFEYPTYEPTSGPPRLTCPCHYSVFDPRTAGEVVDGPAGRDLPQLPLRIASDRSLVAAGGFSAPPGPSWAFVRE